MRKKILLGLTMLFALTASLSAQTAEMITFGYQCNVSEQIFIETMNSINSKIQRNGYQIFYINKLPTPVIQAINDNLHDYTLDIGDEFLALVKYQLKAYHVFIRITIRITDKKKSSWQFYAWREY